MLHLKYRPKTLDEFIGNKPTAHALKALLAKGSEVPHVFLFSGPSGCGKTTLARIIAAELGCEEGKGLIEVNMANNRGIETAREIIDRLPFRPLIGDNTVYLLDECHQTTKDFQNALLKALEDTPSHIYFILCTTEPERLLKTIINRCHLFQVNKLPSNRLLGLLKTIIQREKISGVGDEHLRQIAEASDGCPRQALIMLNEIAGLPEGEVADVAKRLATEKRQTIELCRALGERSSWAKVSKILKGIEDEPERTRRAVLGYFNTVLLGCNMGGGGANIGVQAALIIECFSEPFYNSGQAGLTFACYEAVE